MYIIRPNWSSINSHTTQSVINPGLKVHPPSRWRRCRRGCWYVGWCRRRFGRRTVRPRTAARTATHAAAHRPTASPAVRLSRFIEISLTRPHRSHCAWPTRSLFTYLYTRGRLPSKPLAGYLLPLRYTRVFTSVSWGWTFFAPLWPG